MLPIVGVPKMVRQGLVHYRPLFCREAGFEHVGRYITGLLLSPNKTLQGIYDLQVWEDGAPPSRRAMPEAVFEAGWDADGLMPCHWAVVAPDHRGRGREGLSRDWPQAQHDRGPTIWGVKAAWDHVEKRPSRYQTVVTAVVANRALSDGVAVVVQQPTHHAEEVTYWQETVRASYEQMDEARQRGLELLQHLLQRQSYKKRTAIVLAIVQQLEHEGHFPYANYAFDNGVLTVDWTRFIEQSKKHGVSELESSRPIQWQGVGQRVDTVAAALRQHHPDSLRSVRVRCRNGDTKQVGVFTKVVRLKRYGRKRLVIIHEQADLRDTPCFLLTDALHGESGRGIETWSDRWASEIFHEFSK